MCLLKLNQDFEEALKDAKLVKELDGSFPGIDGTIKELEKLHAERFEKMKDEVFTGLKSLGNMVLGNFGMSMDNFKLQQNPDGTCNISY